MIRPGIKVKRPAITPLQRKRESELLARHRAAAQGSSESAPISSRQQIDRPNDSSVWQPGR